MANPADVSPYGAVARPFPTTSIEHRTGVHPHRDGCGSSRGSNPKVAKNQTMSTKVAERFVVPRKPGNAGGGKGPQFKTDAIRGEGPGDWETYQLQECSETAEGVARESKGVKSCPRAGCGKDGRNRCAPAFVLTRSRCSHEYCWRNRTRARHPAVCARGGLVHAFHDM